MKVGRQRAPKQNHLQVESRSGFQIGNSPVLDRERDKKEKRREKKKRKGRERGERERERERREGEKDILNVFLPVVGTQGERRRGKGCVLGLHVYFSARVLPPVDHLRFLPALTIPGLPAGSSLSL